MTNLVRFRGLVRGLLAEGVAPTATEFSRRGYGYTRGVGSGCCFNSGRYQAARREELLAAGWWYDAKSRRYRPPVSL